MEKKGGACRPFQDYLGLLGQHADFIDDERGLQRRIFGHSDRQLYGLAFVRQPIKRTVRVAGGVAPFGGRGRGAERGAA